MKQFSLLLFVFIVKSIYAQEPRPEWVEQKPIPPTDANFIYVYGMGVGKDETEAELAAWKNALFKSFQEGGLVGVKEQSQTLDEIFSMNDLETIIPNNVLPRRLVCQTPKIHLPNNQMKIYILIQVKQDGSKPTDFYDYKYKITCMSKTFKNTLNDWNHSGYLRQQDKSKYINLEIIGITIVKSDINNGMKLNYSDAVNLCNTMNLAGYKDWRLPTFDELSQMYHQKNVIGGLSDKEYWSSTSTSTNSERYLIDMKNGLRGVDHKSNTNCCRCVRTLSD